DLRRFEDSRDVVQSAAAAYLRADKHAELDGDPVGRSQYFWKVLKTRIWQRYRRRQGTGPKAVQNEVARPADSLDRMAAVVPTPSEVLIRQEHEDAVIARADALADGSNATAKAVIRMAMAGMSTKAIAIKLGRDQRHIGRIIKSFRRQMQRGDG
ncbi:MAG: hypothetical protein AAGJ97_12170, partial [Planctomycetota bacterium]